MKIIIPMAGKSGEFELEGLGSFKPLTKIDGKHMIEHVCSIFPNKSEFVFLCRKQDLDSTNITTVLKKISPTCKIITVDKETRGPAETVLLAENEIKDDEEVIISYSDYFVKWDFWKFVDEARKNNADGALSIFVGFNPASLSGRQYAYINTNDENGLVVEVREKEPFVGNIVNGFTSAGSYYFSRWSLYKKYAKRMIEKGTSVNGLFFVSLVYNEMIADGIRVVPYTVDKFVCFGEPSNVKEYVFWSEYFASLTNNQKEPIKRNMINLVPMAGLGKRFSDVGYKDPKPLIKVLDKPMAVQAALSLPRADKYVFVCLKDHTEWFGLDKLLKKNIPNCEVVEINGITDGMARTCLAAEKCLDPEKPLLISSCDYSLQYDDDKLDKLLNGKPDVVIWTFKEYPDARRNPKAYAYVVVENGLIKRVSEKVPISNRPNRDPAVVGIFYFKSVELFLRCAKQMIGKKIAVNGEYYVATAINELIAEGRKVMPFDIEKFICWGTPEDLRMFEYWEEYFSKLSGHPYYKGG